MRVLAVFVAMVVAAVVLVVATLADAGSSSETAPSALAKALVPVDYMASDRAAAMSCPGLSWTLLAAVGSVESDFGRSDLPGVAWGANAAGAEGPMQFEPDTFAAYDHPVPADPVPTPGRVSGPASPYDPADAVWAAARMLCADGVVSDPARALFDYNHSSAYVSQVLSVADSFAQVDPVQATPAEAEAASWALSQVGRPYVWGGASPASGFDCSGLVLWAYAQAGVRLPRTAQAQFEAATPVPAGAVPVPGDLVFFGPSDAEVTHVGIYLGSGQMVDAPHTGADVRVEADHWSDYLGVRPPVAR